MKLASACQSVSSGSSVSFPFSVVGAAPSGLSAVPVVTQSSVQLISGGGLDLSRSSVSFDRGVCSTVSAAASVLPSPGFSVVYPFRFPPPAPSQSVFWPPVSVPVFFWFW